MEVTATQVNAINLILDHDNMELRANMLQKFQSPLFKRDFDLTTAQHRDRVNQQLKEVLSCGFASVRDYSKDPLKFFTYLEMLLFVDYSLSIKNGVHYTLCGGCIQSVGTEKHYKYFDAMDRGDIVGCFAMTELGHGSDVSGIETRAVYDADTQEFILHSPTESSQKFWIGGLANDAAISTVFAQLYINNVHYGVHVFLVRLRNDDGSICPGVRIKDNGRKEGLNGVDNGRCWFDHYRVPLDSLLDKFAQVSPAGEYSSPIKNSTERFAVMIGGLVAGRVSIGAAGVFAARRALAIAIRYGYARTQFGPIGKEVPIISYLTHQRRLFPRLATSYALQIFVGHCKDTYVARRPSDSKRIHMIVSGFKAWATWFRKETLLECRECCGGQGFAAENLIGPMIYDFDVDTTFEGDNTVLMQQVSKALLGDISSGASQGQTAFAELQREATNFDDIGDLELLFSARQHLSLQKLVTSIDACRKRGANSSEAFGRHLDIAQDVSFAWIELQVMESFRKVLQKNPSVASVLSVVCRLFALSNIERNLAFYLANGLVRTSEVDVIRDKINSICNELYTSRAALSLVEAFKFPDHTMPPISFPDYVERFSYKARL